MPEKKIQRRFTMTSQNEQWILLWPGENCQERIARAKAVTNGTFFGCKAALEFGHGSYQ